MRSISLRQTSRQRAQSIVEFALVLPLFALLLFALIDFARLEFSYISLANGAREMARTASIPGNLNDPIVDSFNNYVLIASDWSGTATADTVAITVTNRSGAASPATTCKLTGPHGSPSVHGLMHSPSADPDACQVPTRTGMAGGSVDVTATYQFTFNPVFQNRLTGIVDASFMQQWATLQTTARAYIE